MKRVELILCDVRPSYEHLVTGLAKRRNVVPRPAVGFAFGQYANAHENNRGCEKLQFRLCRDMSIDMEGVLIFYGAHQRAIWLDSELGERELAFRFDFDAVILDGH